MEEYADEISALFNIQAVKNQILDNAIAKHQARQDKLIASQLSESDSAKVEDILIGDDWVNQLRQSLNGKTGGEYLSADLMAQIQNLRATISQEIPNISQYVKQLSSLITAVEKEYRPIRDSYVRSVVKYFTSNSRVGITSSRGKSLQARIIESLIGQYRGQAFKVSDRVTKANPQAELNESLGKLATLSRMLNSSGGKQYISNMSSGDQRAFWGEVLSSTNDWLDDVSNLFEKAGILAGAQEALSKEKEVLEGLDIKSTQGSWGQRKNIGIHKTLKRDSRLTADLARMDQEFNKGKNTLNQMFRNTMNPKASLQLQWGAGGVIGQVGINVPKAQDISFNSLTGSTSVIIQSNTPMLTLMLREAEMSYNDVVTAINIASAVPYHPSLLGYRTAESNFDDELEAVWQNLMEQLKYQAFYNALAGLGGSNENVFFMSISGQVYSVMDILQRFRSNPINTLSFSNGVMSAGDGLQRAAYQKINQTAFIEGPRSKIYGQARSEKVRPSAISLMQSTKLNISMNLATIANLVT